MSIPQCNDLTRPYTSNTRDLTAGIITKWDSGKFIAAGASIALAEGMSIRLVITKAILLAQEHLMSPKLFTHCKRIHYEMFDIFHEEASYWRRLHEGHFATDQEYIDINNFVCYLTPTVLPLIEDDEIQYWNYDNELFKLSSVHIALGKVCLSWPKEFDDPDPFNPVRRKMTMGMSDVEATRLVAMLTNAQLIEIEAAVDKMNEHERAAVTKSVLFGCGLNDYHVRHPRFGWLLVDEVLQDSKQQVSGVMGAD